MKTFDGYTHIYKHCIHDIKEDNKFVIDDNDIKELIQIAKF